MATKIELDSNKRNAKNANDGDYVFVVEAVDAKGATIKNVDNDTVAIEGNAADYIVKATGAGVIVTKNLDGLSGAELKAAKQFKLTITLQKENAKKGVDDGVVTLAFADGAIDLTRDGKNIVTGEGVVVTKKAKEAGALDIEIADETFGSVTAEEPTEPQPGQSFTLTADADTFYGKAGENNTVTATTATLNDNDIIVDVSSSDNDVIKLTATGNVTTNATILGFEKLDVTWDSFSDAVVEADDFKGLKEVTVATSKLGNLGNLTVNDAGAVTVTAGEGMKGNLVVNGVTTGVVNGGAAKTVTVDAEGSADTDDTVTVTAGETTTAIEVGINTAFDSAAVTAGAVTTDIEVEADKTVTVTAGAATKNITTTSNSATIDASAAAKDAIVTVNKGADASTATVTLGNDATVTSNLAGTEKLTLDVAAGKTVTVDGPSTATGDTMEIKGAGDVTLKISAADLTADTVIKSNTGTLTVDLTGTVLNTAVDTAKVAADLFKVKAASATDAELVAKSGQTFEVSAESAAADLTVGVKTDSAADTLNVTLTSARYAAIAQGTNDIETLTITAAAAQATSPTITDLTIDDLVAGAGNKVVLNGTNDVELTLVTSAKEIDASALNGELVVKDTAATVASLTIAGATGKNNITFDPTALTTGVFIGQGSDDTVNFGAIIAGATMTAVTGAGKDTVEVDASALRAGAGAVSLEMGAGDDTVKLNAATATTGTIVLQFGEGNDTLELEASADLSKANLTMTGLEKLVIDTAATFKGSQLSGKTLVVEGSSPTVDVLKVNATVATGETIDLSGITGTDSISTGILGAEITGLNGNDVLIGTNRDDKITGGVGADVMTGGAGADTFVVAAQSTAAGIDRITDFVGGVDKIKTGITPVTAVLTDLTASNFSTSANLAAAAAAAVAAAEAATTGNYASAGDAVTFKYNDKTYLTINDGANTSFTDGTDILIEITGITGTLVIGDIIA